MRERERGRNKEPCVASSQKEARTFINLQFCVFFSSYTTVLFSCFIKLLLFVSHKSYFDLSLEFVDKSDQEIVTIGGMKTNKMHAICKSEKKTLMP